MYEPPPAHQPPRRIGCIVLGIIGILGLVALAFFLWINSVPPVVVTY